MKAQLVVLFALLAGPAHAEILDEERLAKALTELPQTRLKLDAARQLVTTAINATNGTDLHPALLLAQAYYESRYVPESTSRLVDGKRQTGRWRSRQEPQGWSGVLYCGVTQTAATTWRRCLELRDDHEVAFRTQVRELTNWLKHTGGDLTKALGGYGCGNAGLTGPCNGYPQRVLRLMHKLKAVGTPLS